MGALSVGAESAGGDGLDGSVRQKVTSQLEGLWLTTKLLDAGCLLSLAQILAYRTMSSKRPYLPTFASLLQLLLMEAGLGNLLADVAL